MIGDASLLHYFAFLMDRGMVPYRELAEQNMPGAFFTEWVAMHLLGEGDAAWRVFDFLLLGGAAVSMRALTRGSGWFATIFATGLFALVHGRDGIEQAGQRDLTMAVLLLGSAACLLRANKAQGARARMLLYGAFGLLGGWAMTIKPVALPFVLGFAVLNWWRQRREQGSDAGPLAAALLGALAAPAICLGLLLRMHALEAFLYGLRGIVPYYASLGHKPLGWLLNHSISPLLPVVVAWLLMLCVYRPRTDDKRALLLLGGALGLVAYVAQARGYPYYRYPLLAFLLPLVAVDFTTCLRAAKASRPARALVMSGVLLAALLIAITSAIQIRMFNPDDLGLIDSLRDRLTALGGSALSGHVQCIDSISGCATTLYRMRLVQSSGVLSDFLLFGPDNKAVVQEARATFVQAQASQTPWVMVVTGWLHVEGPGNFQKLDRWPALKTVLVRDYCLQEEWHPSHPVHWWGRSEMPDSYRIYVLRARYPDCDRSSRVQGAQARR